MFALTNQDTLQICKSKVFHWKHLGKVISDGPAAFPDVFIFARQPAILTDTCNMCNMLENSVVDYNL